jgi:hypothetical protein
MTHQQIINKLNLKQVRRWASIVNGCLVAIRPPEVFERMGFSCEFVRLHVQDLLSVQGHRSPGNKIVRGISDASFLRAVAELIGADTSEGDHKLCATNRIVAWKDACPAKLDEMMGEKPPASSSERRQKVNSHGSE